MKRADREIILSIEPSWTTASILEARLHHLFRRDRLYGEWFKPSERLLQTIRFLGSF